MRERFEAKPGDFKLVVLTKSFFHSSLEKGSGGRARGDRVDVPIIIGSLGPPGLQNVEKVFLSERFEAKPGDMKLIVLGSEIPLFNSPPVRAWGKIFGKGRDTGLAGSWREVRGKERGASGRLEWLGFEIPFVIGMFDEEGVKSRR